MVGELYNRIATLKQVVIKSKTENRNQALATRAHMHQIQSDFRETLDDITTLSIHFGHVSCISNSNSLYFID